MATVEDYTSGKVCEKIKLSFAVFDSTKETLNGTDIGRDLLRAINKFEPRKLTIEQATQLVKNAEKCAIGERVCCAIFSEAPLTETIFIDELAQGMVAAGKARFVNKEEAIENIHKYRKSPIIVSKVSGKHSEICFTWPKLCVYWNAEKYGLKCINRNA